MRIFPKITSFKKHPVVSVLRLKGMIADNPQQLNHLRIAPLIEKAFTKGKPSAVALEINSPGGSPVQSSLIAAHIRRLADEKNIPVLAFAEDVAASGGYWLAAAADDIFIDENSIIGSIGVIYSGFGFHKLIDRFGIERRVHTAGESKSFLDPFLPEKAGDVAYLKTLQEPIHASFIEYVKSRRGDRLREVEALFSGRVWVGRGAVDLGLADGIGHLLPKLKELYGDKVKVKRYEARHGLLGLKGLRGSSEGILNALEEKAHWGRYGL